MITDRIQAATYIAAVAVSGGEVVLRGAKSEHMEMVLRRFADMGVTMFNYSPGSGSNRDYLPESDPRFVASQKIYDDILAYERKDPQGLNGFILLLHLGADRRDKMYLLLEPLVKELRARGYSFVRIDEMLRQRG